MEKIRFRFCPTLKREVAFMERYQILKNGNGSDKAIGNITCKHNCSMKKDCKFAILPISHHL